MVAIPRWTGLEAKALRAALRLSVRDFAEHLGVAVRTVSKWEALGAQTEPRPHMQAILDTTLARASAQVHARLRDLLDDGAPGAAEPTPISPVPRSRGAVMPGQVDDLIAHLRDQWHLLVKTDNMLGPRYALRGVLDQLSLIEDMLVSMPTAARREMSGLAAQYAESASWLYEDSGDLVSARQWIGRALEWAHEAGDDRMLCWTLFRRSQQAMHTGNAAQVINLAQAASRVAAELSAPMKSAITLQEAQGFALEGDEPAAQGKVDEAHRWASTDTGGDATDGHGSFCTASYIEAQRAGCLLALGRLNRAVQIYEATVPAIPPVYRRDRGVALARLASAYALAGDLEQSAQTATDALHLAESTGSVRTLREVHVVGQRLRSQPRTPSVTRLLGELAESAHP